MIHQFVKMRDHVTASIMSSYITSSYIMSSYIMSSYQHSPDTFSNGYGNLIAAFFCTLRPPGRLL